MLENINIIDYKCFKDFKLDGLKRINIISGKNNVGKTALLEALYVSNDFSHAKYELINATIIDLSLLAFNRDISAEKFINFIKNFSFSINSNINNLTIQTKKINQLNNKEIELNKEFNADYKDFLICTSNENIEIEPLRNVEYNYGNTSYINSSKPTPKLLVELYSEIQRHGLQDKFLKYVQILDKNITRIEPQLIAGEMILNISLENSNISLPSSELGEGLNRFIEILSIIIAGEWGSVFIDEIENGLHYSKLLDIAKAIIEIAQKEDIQVFITTHDKETIEAFAKASEELSFKDISSIELYKDDENIIHPIVMDYDNIIDGIEMGEDFR